MTQTILVADDSPTIQRRATSILASEGLEVVTVPNGVAAIRKLPTVKPHLILADVSMPGKDGYEVCEFVKNSPELSHVPVLLIFSELEPYQKEKGSLVRADGQVKKPFDHKDLISIVTKFLSLSEGTQISFSDSLTPAIPSAPAHSAELAEAAVESEEQQAPDLTALSEGVAFTEFFGEAEHEDSIEQGTENGPGGESQNFQFDAMQAQEPLHQELPVEEPSDGKVSEADEGPLASGLSHNDQLATLAAEPPPFEGSKIFEILSEAAGAGTAISGDATNADIVVTHESSITETEPLFESGPANEPAIESVEQEMQPSGIEESEPQAGLISNESPAETAAHVSADARPISSLAAETTVSNNGAGAEVETETLTEARVEEAETATDTEAATEFQDATEIQPEPSVTVEAPEFQDEDSKGIDPEIVYSIVHKVVMRMSPPALGSDVLEGIAKRLADEVTAELESKSL